MKKMTNWLMICSWIMKSPIPGDVTNPNEWLESNGYPLRGIISGQGGPLERLGGFVDYFLQPGMKQLPSFIQDTKHTLKIIEEINQKVDNHEVSLERVAIVMWLCRSNV